MVSKIVSQHLQLGSSILLARWPFATSNTRLENRQNYNDLSNLYKYWYRLFSQLFIRNFTDFIRLYLNSFCFLTKHKTTILAISSLLPILHAIFDTHCFRLLNNNDLFFYCLLTTLISDFLCLSLFLFLYLFINNFSLS